MAPARGEERFIDPANDESDKEVDGQDKSRTRRIRYRIPPDFATSVSDVFVLSDAGDLVYRLDGRLLADTDTIRISDVEGNELFRVSAHAARRLDRLQLIDGHHETAGAIVRENLSPLKDIFFIQLQDGDILTVNGDVPGHEYSIAGKNGQVAEISRRWFRARGSFGIEMEPNSLNALVVTSVVVIDLMLHRVD